jgi:hypothetical protein
MVIEDPHLEAREPTALGLWAIMPAPTMPHSLRPCSRLQPRTEK